MYVCEVKMLILMGGGGIMKKQNDGKFGQGVVIELPIPLR